MTQLLVSIRSVEECRTVLERDVDVIDVKNPSGGSLGAAELPVIHAIHAEVAGRRPVSVALGELRDAVRKEWSSLPDVQYAKLGLAGCWPLSPWLKDWAHVLSLLPATAQPVAVAYADAVVAQSPPWRVVMENGAALGCRVLLIDTYNKARGRLLDWFGENQLREIRAETEQIGMQLALAGSLTLSDVHRILPWSADWVAVRSAACAAGRDGPLCADRLTSLVTAVRDAPPW
jgi:uncharacterized protein (UPF0264 family)